MFKRNALLIVLFILLAVALYSQTADKSKSVTTQVKSGSELILRLLHDNDWKAADRIFWDDFSLNGAFLGADYLDAFEYYEEDYFMEDTIEQISKLLRYPGSDKDAYGKFTVEPKGEIYAVKTSNQRKSVTMQLKKYNGDQYLLIKLDITDNK